MNGMNSAGRSKNKNKNESGWFGNPEKRKKKKRTGHSTVSLFSKKVIRMMKGCCYPYLSLEPGQGQTKEQRRFPSCPHPLSALYPCVVPIFSLFFPTQSFFFPQFELSLLFLLPILFVSQSSFCRCKLLFVSCIEGK